MPPDDERELISKESKGISLCFASDVNRYYGTHFELETEWILYDEAIWKELNR